MTFFKFDGNLDYQFTCNCRRSKVARSRLNNGFAQNFLQHFQSYIKTKVNECLENIDKITSYGFSIYFTKMNQNVSIIFSKQKNVCQIILKNVRVKSIPHGFDNSL